LFLGCWILLEWWMRFLVIWDCLGCFWVCSFVCVFLLHAWNSGECCQSRLSELVSPRRECLRLAQVLLEQLAQAEDSCFERPTVSLRREWLAQASSRRRTWCALLASSSRRRIWFWAKGDLAQASWFRPSEMLAECHCSRSRLGEKA